MGIIGDFFSLIICRPLGYILRLCYIFGHDYGIALLLFTLITRVFLLPLAVKQQKSSAEMVRMKPKLDKIQKKYAKDKQKLNEEMMKLYQEEGYNPMGGCLPLLIQLPILWGLFSVVYQPLTYIVGLSTQNVQKVITALTPYMANIKDKSKAEIYAAQVMEKHRDLLTFLPANTMHIKLDFFGFDLAPVPQWAWTPLLLIPILCYVTSLLSSWMSIKLNPAATAQGGTSAKSMNFTMIFFMPLLSTWFCFQVPAGVGFYWICTNLFMILQVVILRKFFNIEKLAEEAEKKAQIRREDRYKKLGIVPKTEEDEETEEANEEKLKEQKAEDKRSSQISTKSAVKTQTQNKSTPSKKKKHNQSKKAIKERNRKLLSASRAKEEAQKKKD